MQSQKGSKTHAVLNGWEEQARSWWQQSLCNLGLAAIVVPALLFGTPDAVEQLR